jgi:hypothetical protein
LETDVVGAPEGTTDGGAATVVIGAADDGESDEGAGAELVLQPAANKIVKNERATKIAVRFMAISPYQYFLMISLFSFFLI